MKDINIIIGTNIKELRKANKLTQYELAEKLNYSNKAISRWESGEVIPDVLTLNKLCEIFNIPLSQIFEANITNTKVKKQYKLQMGNKLAISLLSIMFVWLVATIAFVSLNITFGISAWQLFVWAIPISCIVAIVFNSIWGRAMFNYLLITVLNWSTLASVFLSIHNYRLWLIFIIGIPIQIAIILWSNITKNNINKKNSKWNHKPTHNTTKKQNLVHFLQDFAFYIVYKKFRCYCAKNILPIFANHHFYWLVVYRY